MSSAEKVSPACVWPYARVVEIKLPATTNDNTALMTINRLTINSLYNVFFLIIDLFNCLSPTLKRGLTIYAIFNKLPSKIAIKNYCNTVN